MLGDYKRFSKHTDFTHSLIDDYVTSFIDDYGSSCLKPTQSTNSVMLYHNIQNFFASLKP